MKFIILVDNITTKIEIKNDLNKIYNNDLEFITIEPITKTNISNILNSKFNFNINLKLNNDNLMN